MKLLIGNINIHNEHLLDQTLGLAGFSGSLKMENMCNGVVDLGSEEDRKKAGIKHAEVKLMVGSLVIDGFSASIKW